MRCYSGAPFTYSNYLGYVRLGCILVGAADVSSNSPLLRRAKTAIIKKGHFTSREKRFIQLAILDDLMSKAEERFSASVAMLYLLAYVFMLRVPSEALPLVVGREGSHSDIEC